MTVIPLLVPTATSSGEPANEAVEREIAVMLVGFSWTAAPHSVLPQDVLYLLNRYSEIVGDTVRKEGGVPIQFLGDGVTAVFSLESGTKEANRQALAAAAHVDRRLRALGRRLNQELGWAADFVIHLHTGPAGVGETGDNATRTLAAVGSTIDVARKLSAQHEHGDIAQVVVSEAVMVAAGLDTRTASWREIVLADDIRLKVTSIDRGKTR